MAAEARPRELRLVPRIELCEPLLRAAEGVPGRLLAVALFALGLWLHDLTWWLDAGLVLAVLSLFPARRRLLLVAGTWYWLVRHTVFRWELVREVARREGVVEAIDWPLLELGAVVAALLSCVALPIASRALMRRGLVRRPVFLLVFLYTAALILASEVQLGGVTRTTAWAFLIVFGRYLWFVGYALLERAEDRLAPAANMGHFLGFWMGTSGSATPIPKGAAYLRRTEAKTARELATSQLKGLKLLFWAGILLAAREGLETLVHRGLAIPTYDAAARASLAGTPLAWWQGWLSLFVRFLDQLLSLAIWGHVIVATIRMAGFCVLRNTYRPLGATSIAEFWNRYYYYFKELLVELFFYPTYLRTLKGHPRLRLFVATLAAATFGNALYHFLRDVHLIVRSGPWGALEESQSYGIYALVLGLAIAASQLRAQSRHRARRGADDTLPRRVLATAGVLAFYCVLSVFDDPDRTRGVGDHVAFLLTLVGIA